MLQGCPVSIYNGTLCDEVESSIPPQSTGAVDRWKTALTCDWYRGIMQPAEAKNLRYFQISAAFFGAATAARTATAKTDRPHSDEWETFIVPDPLILSEYRLNADTAYCLWLSPAI